MEAEKKDVYDILSSKIEQEMPQQVGVGNIIIQKILAFLRAKYPNIIIWTGYLFTLYMLLKLSAACIWGVYYLDDSVLPESTVSIVWGLIFPSMIWLYSTCFDDFNYKTHKLGGLTLVLVNAGLVLETYVIRAINSLIMPLIFKIPISRDISTRMVVTLGRCFLGLMLILTAIGIFASIIKNMYHNQTVKMIMYYKLNRNWDTRKHKRFKYDMSIVRRLSNGKMQRVYEEDRFLHCMFIGTTGTGKTSTCMTTSINNDLDQRIRNEDYQKKKLRRLLEKGKIYITRDFDDSEFSADYFAAHTKRYQKKIIKIRDKAPVLGITAMAPNEKFSDELYALTKSKHIKVNRIDPMFDEYGRKKEGFIGMNPLYISPTIEGIWRKLEIFTKARMFADVNQAIFERDKKGDPYFTGVNRNISTAITVMVLLTYPSLHNGKQPTPDVVQDIINNFPKAAKYRNQMVKMYSTKFKANKEPVMEPGLSEVGEYQFILDVIDYDVLGPGAKQMNEQARGLRNIINDTLANPLVRQVLCAENTIDIDRILDKGEVTFINYAITLGSAGTAFGLFFLLSLINAVLRRPAGKKLLPHFIYIDELPELLHPDLSRTFALFRQYRVGMNVALQSLDLLDKSPDTQFLKTVVLGGCASQIVYGRCSTAEMKMYQELGGTRTQVAEMTGTSETALSMENTSMSMMHRETTETVNNVNGGDMRYLDFREVTMFTVSKGSPLLPFFGRTFFLEDIKKIEKRRFVFNWSKYFVPIEGFKDSVSPLLNSAAVDSSTMVSEHERKVLSGNTKEAGVIEASTLAQTTIETRQSNLNTNEPMSRTVYISSGRNVSDNKKEEETNIKEEEASFVIEED